jgi:hypothetical protein
MNFSATTQQTTSQVQGATLRDEKGNLVIFDYFIRRQTLYLVSTFTGIASPQLSIQINGQTPNEVRFDQGEPVRYFWLPVGDAKQFTCRLNGRTQTIRPEIVDSTNRKHKLAVATLFKYETPEEVARFIKYYRNQGVDKFYFYFNGSSLPERMPQADDIFYKLWDFPYWNTNTAYSHLAQTTFLTSYRLRYHETNEWSIMVDLDEYVVTMDPSLRIIDYLNKTTYHLYNMESYWGGFRDDMMALIYNQTSQPKFNKYIYKHYFKGMFGVHGPKNFPREQYLEGEGPSLHIVHIVNMNNKDRTSNVVEPLVERDVVV